MEADGVSSVGNLALEQDGNSVTFRVKVLPGSGTNTFAGIYDGMLKVKIAAAPQKGKANESLIRFLADKLGIRRNCVHIQAGRTAHVKLIRIDNLCANRLLESLGLK